MAEVGIRSLDAADTHATEAAFVRRLYVRLSDRQEPSLMGWGQPYLMEEFRYYFTFPGGLPKDQMTNWADTLRHSLQQLPPPILSEQPALCGERDDRPHELAQRYALSGWSRRVACATVWDRGPSLDRWIT
ncbi:DUF1045 domain-containing protein [Roseobacter sinensis]|uniref:DUF1045 domain-containing protein n=1 Tax=Roseobacter sinensis TaxID=2931391 RepID=UPI003850C1EB